MPSKTFKVTTLMNFTINIHSTVAGNLSIKQSVSMTPCEKKTHKRILLKINILVVLVGGFTDVFNRYDSEYRALLVIPLYCKC